MFNIVISSTLSAPRLAHHWADATITLLSSGELKGFPILKNQMVIVCDDVIDKRDDTAPKEIQIREMLEFTAQLDQECKLLVHCMAGISRSTAAGAAILTQQGMSPVAAMQHIAEIRPQAFPNELIAGHADNILDLNMELFSAIMDFQEIAVERLRKRIEQNG